MNITTRIKTFASNVSILSNVSLRGSLKDFEWFKDNFPSWFDAIGSSGSTSKRQAIKISTIYTCLNILGETFGALPFDVKQDSKEGRVTRKDHNVYRLIHDRPNPFTNAFDFWSTTDCMQSIKELNLKANHNIRDSCACRISTVCNLSKNSI